MNFTLSLPQRGHLFLFCNNGSLKSSQNLRSLQAWGLSLRVPEETESFAFLGQGHLGWQHLQLSKGLIILQQ